LPFHSIWHEITAGMALRNLINQSQLVAPRHRREYYNGRGFRHGWQACWIVR